MDREMLREVVARTLEQRDLEPQDFDVEAIADRVSALSSAENLHDLDPDQYWQVVEEHRC